MRKDVQNMIKTQKQNQWGQQQIDQQYQNSYQPPEPAMHHPAPPNHAVVESKPQPSNGFNIFDNKEISDNLAGSDKNRKVML
jgi:hypothetical protein